VHETHLILRKSMHIHLGSEPTCGTMGSVETGADNLGIASGTALRWHSANSRRHSKPRCQSAGRLLFAVRHLAIVRLRRLVKYCQPVISINSLCLLMV